MNKNNINLPVYSPMPESGVKYWFKFILFLFILFYFILFIKKIYVHVWKINGFIYSLTPELGINKNWFFIIIYMNLKNMRMRNKMNLVYLFIH